MRSRMIVFLVGWCVVVMTGHWWVAESSKISQTLLATLCTYTLLVLCIYLRRRAGVKRSAGLHCLPSLCAINSYAIPFVFGAVLAHMTVCQARFPIPENYNGALAEVSGSICPDSLDSRSLASNSREISFVQIIYFCVGEVSEPVALASRLEGAVLRLSCYYCTQYLSPDRHYQLRVKLKIKRPLLNFHEYWPWQKQWRLPYLAKATIRSVLSSSSATDLRSQMSGSDKGQQPGTAQRIAGTVKRWPKQFRDSTIEHIGQFSFGSSMAALLFGDRSGLSREEWQKLSNSGLTHLLVISGLHLGYIVIMLIFLTRVAFCLANRRTFLYVSLLTVTGSLGFYLAAIDYGIPSLRASLAAVFALLVGIGKFRLLPSSWFLLALVLVSVLDPFAFVSKGFWLSFLGVAILLCLFSHRPWQVHGKLAGLWRAQVGFFVGLAGILLWNFGQLSSASIINNLLAIPLMSVILPLAMAASLFSTLFEPAGLILFTLVDELFGWFWWIADLGNYFPIIRLENSHGLFVSLLSLLAIPCLLHFRMPLASAILSVVVLANGFGLKKTAQPFSVSLLDVGQGQALIINAPDHGTEKQESLIYDAGPAFQRWNAGKRVVLPAFADRPLAEPTAIIVSHNDNDHQGGLEALTHIFPNVPVFSGQAEQVPGSYQCLPGRLKVTRQLQALVLWPLPAKVDAAAESQFSSDNNQSCVLKVSYGQVSVLLTGDLEADAQQALLQNLRRQRQLHLLNADILLLPHHGSKNAFHPEFLSRVNPRYVLVSSGHNNAYGHPNKLFTDWFKHRDIRLLNTGSVGAVEISAYFQSDESFSRGHAYRMDTDIGEGIELRVRTASKPFSIHHQALN